MFEINHDFLPLISVCHTYGIISFHASVWCLLQGGEESLQCSYLIRGRDRVHGQSPGWVVLMMSCTAAGSLTLGDLALSLHVCAHTGHPVMTLR